MKALLLIGFTLFLVFYLGFFMGCKTDEVQQTSDHVVKKEVLQNQNIPDGVNEP